MGKETNSLTLIDVLGPFAQSAERVLAVGDLSTGLVFSHYLKTLSVKVHYCSTNISSFPRNFFIDTRKTEF